MVYIFHWPIDGDFRETEQIVEWCKATCPSYITNTLSNTMWVYEFRFSDERDLIMCKLRWKT